MKEFNKSIPRINNVILKHSWNKNKPTNSSINSKVDSRHFDL